MTETSIRFLSPTHRLSSEKPYTLRFTPSIPFPRSNFETEHNQLNLSDIRGKEADFSLSRNGFTIMALETKLSYDDFDEKAKVVDIYRREAAANLRNLLGAKHVHVLEHIIRKRHPEFPISTGEKYDYNQPTTLAHVDTTQIWATKRAEAVMYDPEHTPSLAGSHWQLINIWRPLKGPVRDWPLAICDNSTVDPDADLVAGDAVYADIAAENFQVYHSPAQKWHYISKQRANEAWVFLQADSGKGARPGCPHSSFPLPSTSADEKEEGEVFPRESIELRCLAFF